MALRDALRPISDDEFDARYPHLKDELKFCTEDEGKQVYRHLLSHHCFFPTISELSSAVQRFAPDAYRGNGFDIGQLHAKGQLKYLIKNYLEGQYPWPRTAGVPPDHPDFPYPEEYERVRLSLQAKAR